MTKSSPLVFGAALALLALLFLGARSCTDREPAAVAPAETTMTTTTTSTAAPAGPAVAVAEQSVPLPGGGTVMLAPHTKASRPRAKGPGDTGDSRPATMAVSQLLAPPHNTL